MTQAMTYWVREAGVDGYRVDAAGLIPQDFWDNASRELRAIKPVFMLAEWESRDMHAYAFDASYAWTWWDGLRAIAEGKADATSLYTYYAWNQKFYPKQAYRMLYTTNHDKNAWDGTEFEIFGPAVDAAIVFSFVSEGMPMIYNGQEAGNRKRLAFFERDPIQWQPSPYERLYKKLLALKKRNTALWNGEWGATMLQVPNSAPKQVFSFVRREREGQGVRGVQPERQAGAGRLPRDLHVGATAISPPGRRCAWMAAAASTWRHGATYPGEGRLMEQQNISSVVIVGGGTAGWMTAAALSRVLGKQGQDHADRIGRDIGTVGVGESTIPMIKLFNTVLGIDEDEFMRETQATFKLGIEFRDWGRIGDSYMHGFGIFGQDLATLPFYQYWLRMHQAGKAPDIERYSINRMAARSTNSCAPTARTAIRRWATSSTPSTSTPACMRATCASTARPMAWFASRARWSIPWCAARTATSTRCAWRTAS
jgi:hypothetical protein